MLLSKADIIEALGRLDEMARDAGMTVDLAIYDGAALALAFDMRRRDGPAHPEALTFVAG